MCVTLCSLGLHEPHRSQIYPQEAVDKLGITSTVKSPTYTHLVQTVIHICG